MTKPSRPVTGAPMAPAPVASGHSGRRDASRVSAITGLRLSPHSAAATLVNISPNGLLAECKIRLQVGSTVTVEFEGDFMPSSVVSRVARCAVSAIGGDGMLRYHVGLAFNKPIDLDEAPEAGETEPEATQAADTSAAAPSPAGPPRPIVHNRW